MAEKPFKDLTDEEADKLISTRGNPNLDSPASRTSTPSSSEGIIPETVKSVGRGLGQNILDLGELGAHFLGTRFDDPSIMQQEREKLKQYVAPPSDESTAQSVVRNLSEYIPSTAFGWGLGGKIATTAESVAAKALGPVYKFTPGGAGMQSTTLRKGADIATRYGVAPGITGGLMGAVADPTHPEKGFIEGAAGGAIARSLGPFLRSPAVRKTLSSAATVGLAHGGGANWYWSALAGLIIPHTRWITKTPLGTAIHFVGDRFVDGAGRVIGEVDTAKVRAAARLAAFGAGKIDPKMVALENVIGDFMRPALPAVAGRAASEALKDEEQ